MRLPLNFGVVVTLKEINGINRIEDFIKACILRGWIVNRIDVQNQLDIFKVRKLNFDLRQDKRASTFRSHRKPSVCSCRPVPAASWHIPSGLSAPIFVHISVKLFERDASRKVCCLDEVIRTIYVFEFVQPT